MQLIIAAIGRASANSPETRLFEEYKKRLPWKLELRERELKRDVATNRRKTEETALLLDACDGAQALIALDERGQALKSTEFAARIGQWQQEGITKLAFLIGGSDGLDQDAIQRAQLRLSFGRMSWPHMLARAMLAEQLYRAHTILARHPYHRE